MSLGTITPFFKPALDAVLNEGKQVQVFQFCEFLLRSLQSLKRSSWQAAVKEAGGWRRDTDRTELDYYYQT